jgi:hypothetical protein
MLALRTKRILAAKMLLPVEEEPIDGISLFVIETYRQKIALSVYKWFMLRCTSNAENARAVEQDSPESD